MQQFATIQEISKHLDIKQKQDQSVGFVPTMGALHNGHLQLIRKAKAENDLTVCSIFVNPIQFNNPADLEKYPRTLNSDLIKLEEAGCDVVFLPAVSEMYPETEPIVPKLDFGLLANVMEGKFRPGHFNGVAIVVEKLFSIVHPTRAYFGKKDYQQLAIIKFMVSQFQLPVAIIPCDTVREPNGLAMSSRNMRLTMENRNTAAEIYRILCGMKERATNWSSSELKNWAMNQFELTPAFRVEYVEIGDCDNLQPIEAPLIHQRGVAFVAVFMGEVRLIDNIELFS